MRKRKKVVKMRGSKTHGYGAKKKHRGKGSKGGKGYAGSFKHKKMMMLKYEPERIKRKKGTTGPKRKKEIKCINLYEIEKIAQGKEIDVTKMGYQKVLGRGEIRAPLTIKAFYFSKHAIEKIEERGGSAIILGKGDK